MLAVAFVLTVLGGVLPVAALVRAGFISRRLYEELDHDLSRIYAIGARPLDPSRNSEQQQEERLRLQTAIRPQSTQYQHLSYMREEIERAILKSALEDLRRPAVFAGLGALAGMAGSLLSLWA